MSGKVGLRYRTALRPFGLAPLPPRQNASESLRNSVPGGVSGAGRMREIVVPMEGLEPPTHALRMRRDNMHTETL